MYAILKNAYHYALAFLGAIIYGFPSRRLTVIGVTGTKGKTSTVELLHAVLEASGHKTALLSSAHIAFGNHKVVSPTGNTMPGRFFIQRFLRDAISKGCRYAVFEVTSQGVIQHRHRFIDFDVAAMTNLHPEHIESHGSFEKYRAAKVAFFRYVAQRSCKARKLFFVNQECADKDYFAEVSTGEAAWYSKNEFLAKVLSGERERVSSWLQSDFNLENAALVYAISRGLGLPHEAILRTFAGFKGVSGRMEFVRGAGKTAVIDYALTPESLKALYQHLTKQLTNQATKGQLIAVFGSAGGGRDTWKRPALGKIADEFAGQIYLTNDDSYDEDVNAIVAEIKQGIKSSGKVHVVIDRKEAIKKALEGAGPNDIVAITGMGSQVNTYGPGGKKSEWSDRQVVEEALKLF